MSKNNRYHRALVVARVKHHIRELGRDARSENKRQLIGHQPSTSGDPTLATSHPQVETPLRVRYASGRRMGTVQNAFTLGELKATHKRQFHYKLVAEHERFMKPNEIAWILLASLRLSIIAPALWSWTTGIQKRTS